MRKIDKCVVIKGCIILLRASILREIEKAEEAIKAKKIKKREEKKDYCFIELRE
jgi:hypothetical protein